MRLLRLLLCFAFIGTCAFSGAEGDDPFGDPFSESQGAEDPDFGDASSDDASSWATLPSLELNGKVAYTPTIFADYEDEEFSHPIFLSNAVEAELDVSSRFGKTGFQGGLRAKVGADADNNPIVDLSVNDLHFNFRTDALDLTVGRFALEWSAMNVFKLSDFFTPSGALSLGLESQGQPVTGMHFIAYLGPFSAEGVLVPLYYLDAGIANMAGNLGISVYPNDIAVVFSDRRPGLSLEYPQAAIRLGLGLPFFDAYLYYFHGFSNQTLNTSRTEYDPPATVTLEIETIYEIVDCIGISATVDVLGLVINGEAVITFDAPVHVSEEVDLPIGTVTNTVLGYAPLLQWSVGLEWEIISNLRLLMEYTDVHILSKLPETNNALLGGDNIFGILDLRLPVGLIEPWITAGGIYDWAGHDFTAIATLGIDFLNGLSLEVSGIYFDIFEATDSTSPMYEQLENDLIISLSGIYTF